ncbi:MAG TPA: hypothetical protein PLP05_03785 [Sedimentisphaerales bacterium]|nr:hypothetical protein [Sedimentisphaerales bacterium]
MQTIWIEQKKLENILAKNEAFWLGELDEGPVMWVTAPNAKKGIEMPQEPADKQQMWTDIDYLMKATESQLSRTYYAGDSLPVFNPWLGPDQVASWLGAKITLKPKEFTSWVEPFVDDWAKYPKLEIAPDNKWWNLYLNTVKASVRAGKDKWVTAYPDLHTGVDGLSAIRGAENLMIDMLMSPEIIKNRMQQMTQLFKDIVDQVSDIVIPAGQGTSNWTMGWSSKRFLCIGQNDFSCMISPAMFTDFCWPDTLETANYSDYNIYHLDGPDAARHLPKILELEKVNCIQWIQGAGNPYPSKWLDMLKKIQDSGKSVQLCYLPGHGEGADFFEEVKILCNCLDVSKLFFWFVTDSKEKADALVKYAKDISCGKKY